MDQLDTLWTAVLAWLGVFADPAWLNEWFGNLARGQPLALLGLLAVPVALALVSGRPLGILAVLLMVMLTHRVILNPAVAAEWTVPAIYVASLVVAVMQWLSARRHKRLRAEVSALREDVDRMRQAEQRRYIADLKSSPAAPDGDKASTSQ